MADGKSERPYDDNTTTVASITVGRAKAEKGTDDKFPLNSYMAYWGMSHCQPEGGRAPGGKVQNLSVNSTGKTAIKYVLPKNTEIPQGTTHVHVCPTNKLGEAKHCSSARFVGFPPDDEPDIDDDEWTWEDQAEWLKNKEEAKKAAAEAAAQPNVEEDGEQAKEAAGDEAKQ